MKNTIFKIYISSFDCESKIEQKALILELESLYDKAVDKKEVVVSGLVGFAILYSYLYEAGMAIEDPKSIFSDLDSLIYKQISYSPIKTIEKEKGIVCYLLYYFVKRLYIKHSDEEILAGLYIDELLIYLSDDLWSLLGEGELMEVDDAFYALLLLVVFEKEKINNSIVEKSINFLFHRLESERSKSELSKSLYDLSVIIYKQNQIIEKLKINESFEELVQIILKNKCLNKYDENQIKFKEFVRQALLDDPMTIIFLVILI